MPLEAVGCRFGKSLHKFRRGVLLNAGNGPNPVNNTRMFAVP